MPLPRFTQWHYGMEISHTQTNTYQMGTWGHPLNLPPCLPRCLSVSHMHSHEQTAFAASIVIGSEDRERIKTHVSDFICVRCERCGIEQAVTRQETPLTLNLNEKPLC